MVHWQTVIQSMSFTKSIQTSSSVLSKKGCNYSSPSRNTIINKHHNHHLSSSPHRSHHNPNPPSSAATTTTSSSTNTHTPHKHLFNAKPKDSIFDEDDVNQICLHLQNQKLSLTNNTSNQPRMGQNNRNNRSNSNHNNHISVEYKEEQINDALSVRMPNTMNEILCRSKSLHETMNISITTTNYDNYGHHGSSSTHSSLHSQQHSHSESWTFSLNNHDKNEKIKIKKEIQIDNNLNISNIVPGGISMQNVDKFQHDDDEHEQEKYTKYPQNNIVNDQQQHQDINQDGNGSINIKHSPFDGNLTWNCVNITL